MAFNPLNPAEAGKFASEHARIRKIPEPKDVFTEEDCLNHLSPQLTEEANKNPYFKAALLELFKYDYNLKYYAGQIGLTANDIANVELFINKNVEKFK